MSSSVRCLLLFESLHERYSPGGREELESIQRYLRQLPAASDFKAAMTTIRRWKLARGRAQSLGLPEQAPNESIGALDSLMKILEKRNTQLAMKLNLLRMQPDIIIPATSGLERYLNLLEVECRRLASDQEVRDARAAHSSEEVVVAAEAAAKGKGRLCFYFGKPGGCWRGADCPFAHQEGSGKNAEASKDDNKDKGRVEAKAAVAGLLGVDSDMGPGASSVRVIARAAREITDQGTDSESGSRLSDAGSADSSDSTGRAIDSGSEGESEGRHRLPLWYLVLHETEYALLSSGPFQLLTHAIAPFQQVNGPNLIAVGIWQILEELDFQLPIEDSQIGLNQYIIEAHQTLCMYQDGVLRPVVLVHVVDEDTGREQMLALTESEIPPRIEHWTLE
ncbi:unnamed protein product, partial [Symbiodinium sp. CCMP2456]